jgi:hypothetical protein
MNARVLEVFLIWNPQLHEIGHGYMGMAPGNATLFFISEVLDVCEGGLSASL